MKKSIYSITALLTILMVGCTKFDAPSTETYAPAPEFSVDNVAVADSSATFKLVIDRANTTRFTVALINDNLAAAEYPDSMSLLKGNVSAKSVKQFNADTLATEMGTLTFSYPGLMPNTPYTFVAVVSNKFGMVSSVKGTTVLTTDNLSPVVSKATPGDAGSFSVAFSEPMQRGEGKITAKYYAPFDLSVTGDIDSKFINCSVDGKNVSISCDSVPAGALVLVSWEAGAFKDLKGNNCNANVTEINMTTGRVANGCYFYVENEPFSFSMADVSELYEPFVDYTVFEPTIGYDKPMFINYDEDDNQPQITLFYNKDEVETKLPAIWDVNDTAIIISFNKEMEYGAKVSFSIPEGAVVDAFGNPNEAFEIEGAWMRSYGLTVDDILGVYDVQYLSAASGAVEECSMLITRSADGLQVSRLFYDESVLSASFDGDLGILFIDDFQYITTLYDVYDIYFATGTDKESAQLQYNPDNRTFSSNEYAEMGQYYVNTTSGKGGWMDFTETVTATYSDDQSVNYPNNLMLGSYQWIFHSYFDQDPDTRDTITCTIADADTSLVIKDFYFEGSEIVAYFDSINGSLVIPDWQLIGIYAGAYECFNSTYDLGAIIFTCAPDGSAVAKGSESENNILWGIQATQGGVSKGWLELSMGDLILKPYTPEVTASVRASKRSASLEIDDIK